jgi:hypothetical protein
MYSEWDRMWKWSWPDRRYCPSICLDGLRKYLRNFRMICVPAEIDSRYLQVQVWSATSSANLLIVFNVNCKPKCELSKHLIIIFQKLLYKLYVWNNCIYMILYVQRVMFKIVFMLNPITSIIFHPFCLAFLIYFWWVEFVVYSGKYLPVLSSPLSSLFPRNKMSFGYHRI